MLNPGATDMSAGWQLQLELSIACLQMGLGSIQQ